MEIRPVAIFRSPFREKFGIPRQSGLAGEVRGRIVFEPDFRDPAALRGLEAFDYLWLIWEFSANRRPDGLAGQAAGTGQPPQAAAFRPTVRPPRLGGNERIGVFASRSPFRPNPLGLSCVRLDRIEWDTPEGPVIHVLGADLMDGTPVYDIKPYVRYADSRPDAHSGFVDGTDWQTLEVVFPADTPFVGEELEALRAVLAQDPRPPYHDDPGKVYGMAFAGRDVHFRVEDGILTVTGFGALNDNKSPCKR